VLTDYVQTNLTHLEGVNSLIGELTKSFGFNIEFLGITVGPDMQALAQLVFTVILLVANIFAGKNLVTVFGGKNKKKNKKQ